MRQGEDDMYVADWQQFFAAFGQPLVARVGLALRTVPVAAGVVASWPHREQRFKWPPSVAVRQNSMAYSTRRWSHVNQDRFLAMKLLRYCRMMSATSKGGRFMASASSESA